MFKLKSTILTVIVTLKIQQCLCQVLSLGVCPNPPAMSNFDMVKYLGTWHEIQKYWFIAEVQNSCVRVDYFRGDQIDEKHGFRHGEHSDVESTFGVEISQIQGGLSFKNPGRTIFRTRDTSSADLILDLLIVQSFVPFIYRFPYLVLHTDYDNYTIKWGCQQVGTLNLQYLWILSRRQTLSEEKLHEAHTILRNLGIPTQMLKNSVQTGC